MELRNYSTYCGIDKPDGKQERENKSHKEWGNSKKRDREIKKGNIQRKIAENFV